MHLIGRWERVRGYQVGPGRWDPPLMLDRKWSTLSPFACEEWHQTRNGVWIPAIRGGSFAFPGVGPYWTAKLATEGLGALSMSTLALNSAYTFNSGGDGVAMHYVGAGKAVANAYYYIPSAATGTKANINDINAELRNDNGIGNAPNRASPTLHSSGSADPNGDDVANADLTGWHKIALSAFPDTYGTAYWLIIADADGGGVDYATVQFALGSGTDPRPGNRLLGAPFSHTAGFNANPSAAIAYPNLVLEYSNGSVLGWSSTSHAEVTSNTEEKGLRLGGMTEQIKLLGAWANVNADRTGLKVYLDDGTVPGGTTQASGSAATYVSGTLYGMLLSSAYTIPKATALRIVFTGTLSRPRKLAIGTDNGYTTITRAARPGGADWYYAWANGTTDWANDDQDAQPDMTLLFEDQVAVAGGGGLAHIIGG